MQGLVLFSPEKIEWVWREKNRRQFQGLSMPAIALGSLVVGNVRACLCSWRKLKPTDVIGFWLQIETSVQEFLVSCALAILLLVHVFLVSYVYVCLLSLFGISLLLLVVFFNQRVNLPTTTKILVHCSIHSVILFLPANYELFFGLLLILSCKIIATRRLMGLLAIVLFNEALWILAWLSMRAYMQFCECRCYGLADVPLGECTWVMSYCLSSICSYFVEVAVWAWSLGMYVPSRKLSAKLQKLLFSINTCAERFSD